MRKTIPTRTLRKFVNIERELQRHGTWFRNMTENKHKVLLAGAGAQTLSYKLHYPLVHWMRHGDNPPIVIWAIIAAIDMEKYGLRTYGRTGMSNKSYLVEYSSKVVVKDRFVIADM